MEADPGAGFWRENRLAVEVGRGFSAWTKAQRGEAVY